MDAHHPDEEKSNGDGIYKPHLADTASEEMYAGESPPGTVKPPGFLATLRHYEAALDRLLGVEAHAISRKKAEDKDPSFRAWHNQAVMFLLWMSSTLNLSCFTTGFLGWEFGLDLRRSIVLIIFGTLCGSAVTVSFSSLNLTGTR